MMSMFRALWRGPDQVVDWAGLRDLVASRSAYVVQKCTIEYCRARSGLMWDKLFLEQAFLDALEFSRWEAFEAVLADTTLIVEGKLRCHASDPAGMVGPLAELARDALYAYDLPAHRAAGWDDVIADLRTRLARAQLAAPQLSYEIARTAGRRVYGTLPIHPTLTNHDEELVTNNIRLNLTRVAEDMTGQLRPGEILGDLQRRRAA